MTPFPPSVRRWRLLPSTSLPRGSAPLGVSSCEPLDAAELREGDALWFVPAGVDPDVPAALASALPDPATFRGLIVVGPTVAERGFFARVLGRETRVRRAVRGSALLLRGYRDVGGGLDPASGLDLCWATSAP